MRQDDLEHLDREELLAEIAALEEEAKEAQLLLEARELGIARPVERDVVRRWIEAGVERGADGRFRTRAGLTLDTTLRDLPPVFRADFRPEPEPEGDFSDLSPLDRIKAGLERQVG